MIPKRKNALNAVVAILCVAAARPLTAQSTKRVIALPTDKQISRVLFGSCIKQNQPMPILKQVVEHSPELFLFIGDNIYADTEDMSVMRAKYAKLSADAHFQSLLRSTPVMAVWDDHDFGVNDGGADYAKRHAAQVEFQRFWQVSPDSERRQRSGIYTSAIFGPVGRRVQIILLDTRYFRSPLAKGERRVGGPYIPSQDTSKTMLGEPQWRWLESQLRKDAELRLLVSSIQCVADDAGQETWSNLPRERQRLFDLIANTAAKGVILLSGDRHWAELSLEKDAGPYPIYDLTSSSLNQLHGRGTPTVNKKRAIETTYHRENFGEVSIDWSVDDPTVTLVIRDMQGDQKLGRTIRLSELR